MRSRDVVGFELVLEELMDGDSDRVNDKKCEVIYYPSDKLVWVTIGQEQHMMTHSEYRAWVAKMDTISKHIEKELMEESL